MRASLQRGVARICAGKVRRAFYLGYEPTPEANSDGVGSATRLELREQMADVRFDRLLRQKQPLADLAIDETVGYELENLDLPGSRLLFELPLLSRGERDHGAGPGRATACRSRLKSAAVVAVAAQDLLTLSGVHNAGIGAPVAPL